MRAVFSALPMRTSVALALGLTALPLIAVAPASAQTYGTDQNYCDRSLLEKMTSTSTGNLVGTAAGAAWAGFLAARWVGAPARPR